jgi:hypothetical protein
MSREPNEARSGESRRTDELWGRSARGEAPKEEVRDKGGRGFGDRPPAYGSNRPYFGVPRGSRDNAPPDDVDDKWSRAFKRSGAAAPPAAPSGGNNRWVGGGQSFDAQKGGFKGFGGHGEGGFGRRETEGGFGGVRRDEGGYGRRDDREGGYPPRREGGGFGGDRASGGYSRDGYTPRGPRRDNGEVIDDPRFIGKFSSDARNFDRPGGYSGGRGGGGGRFGRERDRDRDSYQQFSGPLPTAPKGSLSASDRPVEVAQGLLGQMRVAGKPKKEKKAAAVDGEPRGDPKPKARTLDEEAVQRAEEGKEEAAAAAEAARKAGEVLAQELLSSGIRGAELAAALREQCAEVSPAALLRCVLLAHRDSDVVAQAWWEEAQCGAALKAFVQSVEQQALAVFGVQAYCAEKQFPKIQVKGASKKLIEVLFNLLLKFQIVDVDGFLAWADDVQDRPFKGRTDAIVHTTTFIQALRELDQEEVEEADEDAIDVQREFIS